jgi:hypothetical protein
MGSVAIEDWSVSIPYLTGMVHDDYKAPEPLDILGNVRVALKVGNNVSSLDVSGGETCHVETNVITRQSLVDLLVMNFNGLNLSFDTSWAE